MNIIVIGLGSMGKRRIRLLKRFQEVNKIIGVDTREDRRNEVSTSLGIKTYRTIEEALKNNNDINCSFICTSPLSHSSLITYCLTKGFDVFSEINLVSDGYDENIKLARDKNKTLFLSSTFFYREEIRFISNTLLRKNNLNYIYHIGQYLPDWHPWEDFQDSFLGDKKTNGCREILAIELPWLLNIFGKVENINVISDKMSKLNIPYKDNYLIQLKHENGNKGTLIVDVVSPKAVRNLEIYGENIYYSWNGTPGCLEYFDSTKKQNVIKHFVENEHLKDYSPLIIENAYEAEIREFINIVNKKTEPKYDFYKDKIILDLIDRIEED